MPIAKTYLAPVKGLDVGAPGTLVDKNSTTNCGNVEINRYLIRKRLGGSVLGATLAERILAYGGFQENGVNYLLRVGPTKVQSLDASGTSWVDIHNSLLAGGDDLTVDFAFPLLSGLRVAVYTNYVNNIRKWTGTGNDSDLSGAPKCKFLLNYKGYLMALNVDDGSPNKFRQRVQWCDVGDIEEWDESVPGSQAGAVDLLEDDLEITGGAYFGDYAAIHKANSIYLGYLTGNDDIFRFDRKETTAGTCAHKTILNLPSGNQIFLSTSGFRLFNGISAPWIESTINEEIVEFLNPSFNYRCWGIIVKELNEAWFGLTIGSDALPRTIYKYNYLTGDLFKDSFADTVGMVTAAGLFLKSTDASWDSDSDSWDTDTSRWDTITALAANPRVIWGFDEGISIERTDSPNDNGIAIAAFWDSKDFTAEDFGVEEAEGTLMEWQEVEIVAKGTGLTLSYSTDEGVTFTPLKTFALNSEFQTDATPARAYFRKTSTKLRLRFENSVLSGTFSLKQFRIKAIAREERR